MNLYYCTANSPIGQFGEYVFATSRAEAEIKFHSEHGTYPTQIKLERKSK
jgi:hypothetical protein